MRETMKTSRNRVDLHEFKQWAHDCAPAARAVLMARVFAEMERERVNAYILPLFQSYRFTYGALFEKRAGQPIETPDRLYCADDDVQVAAYFAECDAAHRAHGFTGPAGHCPALTAEHIVIEAECALIELARPLFGIDSSQVFGDDRSRYLELLIGACVKAGAE